MTAVTIKVTIWQLSSMISFHIIAARSGTGMSDIYLYMLLSTF